jgi:hypothetical protein
MTRYLVYVKVLVVTAAAWWSVSALVVAAG